IILGSQMGDRVKPRAFAPKRLRRITIHRLQQRQRINLILLFHHSIIPFRKKAPPTFNSGPPYFALRCPLTLGRGASNIRSNIRKGIHPWPRLPPCNNERRPAGATVAARRHDLRVDAYSVARSPPVFPVQLCAFSTACARQAIANRLISDQWP